MVVDKLVQSGGKEPELAGHGILKGAGGGAQVVGWILRLGIMENLFDPVGYL